MSEKRKTPERRRERLALADKLYRLAQRLRAGEDPERIADEIESLTTELRGRPPGRPKAPPGERGLQRCKRVFVADAIYQGDFPATLYPAALDLTVRHAKGKRAEADAAAAQILGVSLRTIQAARVSNRRMTREQFEEFLAVMRLAHLARSATNPSE
jgi:hypothetical protein